MAGMAEIVASGGDGKSAHSKEDDDEERVGSSRPSLDLIALCAARSRGSEGEIWIGK